jgi:hypothetical protein
MLPRPPRITRCHACRGLYWVFLAEELSLDFGQENPDPASAPAPSPWKDAPHVLALGEADCFEALALGLGAAPDLELELRVLAWWRGNDAFREPIHPPGHPHAPEALENMERIIAMTTHGDEDLLLFRAEAQRQLGRFQDALETLRGVGCSDYWPAKSRQLELIHAQSRNLAILFMPKAPQEQDAAPAPASA